jgi:hypothetical protein
VQGAVEQGGVEGKTSGVLGGGVRELCFGKELVVALPDGAEALELRAIGKPSVGEGCVEALGLHLGGTRGRPLVEIEGKRWGSWGERAAGVASPSAILKIVISSAMKRE